MAEARVVDVPHLHMSEPVTARGEMRDLIAVFDSLAWKLTRELDPAFNVAEETFVAAGKGLRLDAFEQYIRGITEPDQAERLRHLNEAVKLSPDFGPHGWRWGAKTTTGSNTNRPRRHLPKWAATIRTRWRPVFIAACRCCFRGAIRRPRRLSAGWRGCLPLAEVVNNEGVAVSRQGHDGSALFRRQSRPTRMRRTTTSTWP